MNRRETGSRYEKQAAVFLEQKGYEILEMNFRCRRGEIDLVARDGEYLVFVEVKTRRSDHFAPACAAVDAAKQRRMVLTAEGWLAAHPTGNLQPRFDVVEVYGAEGGPACTIRHLKNAFDA